MRVINDKKSLRVIIGFDTLEQYKAFVKYSKLITKLLASIQVLQPKIEPLESDQFNAIRFVKHQNVETSKC